MPTRPDRTNEVAAVALAFALPFNAEQVRKGFCYLRGAATSDCVAAATAGGGEISGVGGVSLERLVRLLPGGVDW